MFGVLRHKIFLQKSSINVLVLFTSCEKVMKVYLHYMFTNFKYGYFTVDKRCHFNYTVAWKFRHKNV